MAETLPVVKQFARNVEIRFQFVEWNEATEVFDAVDITGAFSGAGSAHAVFKKPSGQVVTEVLSDGGASSGFASFFTNQTFLDEFGGWEAEGRVNLPGSGAGQGWFPSRIVRFEVERLLGNEPLHTPEALVIQIAPQPVRRF